MFTVPLTTLQVTVSAALISRHLLAFAPKPGKKHGLTTYIYDVIYLLLGKATPTSLPCSLAGGMPDELGIEAELLLQVFP